MNFDRAAYLIEGEEWDEPESEAVLLQRLAVLRERLADYERSETTLRRQQRLCNLGRLVREWWPFLVTGCAATAAGLWEFGLRVLLVEWGIWR